MPKATPKHKKKARPRKSSLEVKRRKRRPAPIKAPRARKPKRLKVKAKKVVRRSVRVVKKATRQKFAGGLTTKVAKGYRALKEFFSAPVTTQQKAKALNKIGIRAPQPKRRPTKKQRRKIETLYEEYGEFARAPRGRFKIIATKSKDTLSKARKSGMAVYENKIYVHVARSSETVRARKFMGEKIIARTYYGKLERIFLGGADVFDRVVKKLRVKKLAPGQMITGAFFGGPTFHRAIYQNVGEFLNYLNNVFVPHMAKGTKPTKRNIARAKAALMKNIAVVEIENEEFDEE